MSIVDLSSPAQGYPRWGSNYLGRGESPLAKQKIIIHIIDFLCWENRYPGFGLKKTENRTDFQISILSHYLLVNTYIYYNSETYRLRGRTRALPLLPIYKPTCRILNVEKSNWFNSTIFPFLNL